MTFTYPSHTTKGCVPLSSDVKDGAEHTVKEISFYARKPYKIGDRVTLYWDSEAQMAKEAEKAPVGLIFILLFFAAVFYQVR